MDDVMSVLRHRLDPTSLGERLRNAHAATRPLMLDVIDKACRRFPSLGQSERTARLARLIDAGAWADAALALLELELPHWLDRAIEARDADLALALLSVFTEAQMLSAEASRPSVPIVRQAEDA